MSNTGVSAYAYVFTRVRGMIGKLLELDTYNRMAGCPDLFSLFGVLKDTEYGEFLLNPKENVITARRASYEIRKKLTQAFRTILKFSPENVQALLTLTFQLYEVDNLKAVLRGIEIGKSWETIRTMLFPMEDFQTLPFEELVRLGSVESAISHIPHSPYCQVLTLALNRYREEKSLFPLEVALDLDYWRKVWEQVNALPKSDREIARKLFGMLIDKNNLTWAARYRIYHHFSESEIINYTLPFGYKIDDTVIRGIASGRELPEMIEKAYPSMAVFLMHEGKAIDKLPMIEVALMRMFLQTCRSTFAQASFNIGLILAYLFTLEIEIQDITLLIEAKALGIRQERFTPYLINQVNLAGKN